MNKPYYALIFTNKQTDNLGGYNDMADTMEHLAKKQPGYICFESARNDLGIAISYWETLEDIKNWKANFDHLEAQVNGKNKWYSWYKVRICNVEREYEFNSM
jgi:heme-degrading monooxygenase HmoA